MRLRAVSKEDGTYVFNYGLLITPLENDVFVVENSCNKLVGYCKALDDYNTRVRLDHNYTKGKNGRLYESKKLYEHNMNWFYYILTETGFVREAKTIA